MAYQKRRSNSIGPSTTVLYIDTVSRTLLTLVFMALSQPACAGDIDLSRLPGSLAPSSLALHRTVKRIHLTGCATAACTAVLRLNDIVDIILDGEATTMGATRYFYPDQPYVEERRLHRVLLDHPNRFGPMCELLTSLASRYALPGAHQGPDYELFFGVEAVDLALRMDGYGQPRCLPAVLAAMPRSPEADTAIGNARDLCEGNRFAHDPCERIVRPPTP